MVSHGLLNIKVLVVMPLLTLLLLAVACGGEDPTQTPQPIATSPPAATAVPVAPAPVATVPVAAPTPTRAPAAKPTAKGQLNIALKETGVFNAHPRTTKLPMRSWIQVAGFEGLATLDIDREIKPQLAKEWSVSPDSLVWTFKLQEGVQLHKGYGEMTADDVIYSIQQAGAEGSFFSTAKVIRDQWSNPKGWVKAVDSHTVQVHTGTPKWDMVYWNMTPSGSSVHIVSKKQVDEKGETESERNGAGTGPWEIDEAVSGQFWRWKAVEGHWRKTPEFAELTMWEIPEESTRLANFQTGKVDTFAMSFDSIPAVEKVKGAKFMVQKGVAATSFYLMGHYYYGAGTSDQSPAYNPDLPWISSDPVVGSPGWERAKKVRLAMSLAIDRQLMIDTILGGYGSQTAMMWWAPFGKSTTTGTFKWKPEWKWEYDPGRAKQLLTEAGYPNGFDVTVTPAIRGAPGEVEACEAIMPMWEAVGIKAKFRRLPYSSLSQEYRERAVDGVTCHASHPFVDPLLGFTQVHRTKERGGTGIEYPAFDDNIDKANGIFDRDERIKVTYELGDFIWDNVLDVALYYVDFVYPLGPRIDDWSENLRYADARLMSALEYVPHRK